MHFLAFVFVLALTCCFGDVWAFRYGSSSKIRADVQKRFAKTIRAYSQANTYCHAFGRLWGLFDSYENSDCEAYFDIYRLVVMHRSARSDGFVALPDGEGYLIHTRVLVDVVKAYFDGMMEPRFVSGLIARVQSASSRRNNTVNTYLDQEQFMTMCMQERKGMEDRVANVRNPGELSTAVLWIVAAEFANERCFLSVVVCSWPYSLDCWCVRVCACVQALRSLFMAVDINGDGRLSLLEFRNLVRYVDPTCTDEQVQLCWYHAVLLISSVRVSNAGLGWPGWVALCIMPAPLAAIELARVCVCRLLRCTMTPRARSLTNSFLTTSFVCVWATTCCPRMKADLASWLMYVLLVFTLRLFCTMHPVWHFHPSVCGRDGECVVMVAVLKWCRCGSTPCPAAASCVLLCSCLAWSLMPSAKCSRSWQRTGQKLPASWIPR